MVGGSNSSSSSSSVCFLIVDNGKGGSVQAVKLRKRMNVWLF